jgi:hypothetical protein
MRKVSAAVANNELEAEVDWRGPVRVSMSFAAVRGRDFRSNRSRSPSIEGAALPSPASGKIWHRNAAMMSRTSDAGR